MVLRHVHDLHHAYARGIIKFERKRYINILYLFILNKYKGKEKKPKILFSFPFKIYKTIIYLKMQIVLRMVFPLFLN